VLSDLRRPRPDNEPLFRWRETVAATPKYLSVISILEIEYGILKAESRREGHAPALRRWMDDLVLPTFEGAVLAVDVDVALACAKLQRVRSLPHNDSLIAATALVSWTDHRHPQRA